MTFPSSEKADAEVIGHVILLSLTIIGIGLITLVGVPTVYKLEEMVTVRNIEQTYTMLDSRASKVSLGESQQQVIDLNLEGGSMSVLPNSSSHLSYILFELKNGTGTNSIPVSMGKIVYTMGDREVAYEGGGVWSKYPAGSVMLSPPEFNYNGVTMTFPVVNISGNISAGGKGTASLRLEKKNSTNNTQIIFPTDTYRNPLDQNITKITITIRSEYYDAWADYFESRSLVNVNSYPEEKKVVVSLDPPPLFTNFSYGVLASEIIELGNGGETNSYNSSIGNHSVSLTGNGTVRAMSLIKFCSNGQCKINGDAMTGGDITGKGNITGEVWADSISSGVTHPYPKHNPVKGINTGNTVGLVQTKIDDYKASNNNNDSSAGGCITGTPKTKLIGGAGSPCTISKGIYYLSQFSLPNNYVLIFDTTSGPIKIATDNDVITGTQSNITVIGNNPVTIYTKGKFEIKQNVKINPISNDKSSLFQVISSSTQGTIFGTQSYYSGFIWAPFAVMDNANNGEIYGAVVGRIFKIGTKPNIYFDEALKNIDSTVNTGTVVTYLYVTRNDIVAGID